VRKRERRRRRRAIPILSSDLWRRTRFCVLHSQRSPHACNKRFTLQDPQTHLDEWDGGKLFERCVRVGRREGRKQVVVSLDHSYKSEMITSNDPTKSGRCVGYRSSAAHRSKATDKATCTPPSGQGRLVVCLEAVQHRQHVEEKEKAVTQNVLRFPDVLADHHPHHCFVGRERKKRTGGKRLLQPVEVLWRKRRKRRREERQEQEAVYHLLQLGEKGG